MKTNEAKNKITLNKTTVANLGKSEMKEIKGKGGCSYLPHKCVTLIACNTQWVSCYYCCY